MPTLAPPWGPCCYLDYHIGWYWEKLSHWVTLGRSWLVISMSCQSGMFSENLFSLLSFKLPVSFFAIGQVATHCCWFCRDWIICVISGTWKWFLVLSPGREERGGEGSIQLCSHCSEMWCNAVQWCFVSFADILFISRRFVRKKYQLWPKDIFDMQLSDTFATKVHFNSARLSKKLLFIV